MTTVVHLLVPFAASSLPGFRDGLMRLQLPHLSQLLPCLSLQCTDEGSEHDFSLPHERAMAAALGLPSADGYPPWAAWEQRKCHQSDTSTPTVDAKGAALDDTAWAWISPCHWSVRLEGVLMPDISALQLSAQDSQEILEVAKPLFEEAGVALQYAQPLRWLAHGEVFRHIRSASLDRVQNNDVTAWLADAGFPDTLRRLMGEVEMHLHQWPRNAERERRGLPTVNAFWISGAGALPAALRRPGTERVEVQTLKVVETLRDSVLCGDAQAWMQAWQQLDRTGIAGLLELARKGGNVRLTLCGERNAQTFAGVQRGWWQNLLTGWKWKTADPLSVLEPL